MNKRELMKWVDSKESECMDAIESAAKKAVDMGKDKVIKESGLKELMEEFYTTNSDWFDRFNALIDSNEDIRMVSRNYFYSMLSRVSALSTKNAEDVLKIVKEDMDRGVLPSLEPIKAQTTAARNKVMDNYRTVRENIRRCSTAKIAIEYLKELGFDVPNEVNKKTEKPQLPALPVDTRYLFVKTPDKSGE